MLCCRVRWITESSAPRRSRFDVSLCGTHATPAMRSGLEHVCHFQLVASIDVEISGRVSEDRARPQPRTFGLSRSAPRKYWFGSFVPILKKPTSVQNPGRSSCLPSFGTVPFGRETEPFPVAPPWLIYSELMYCSDPRTHEAAEEIEREFLA